MKNKVYLYVYYALLLLALIARQSVESDPSGVVRYAFVLAVVLPTLFVKNMSYTAIIMMFYTVSVSGVGYSYMPYTLYIYVIITFLVFFLYRNKKQTLLTPYFLIFFVVYVFLVDLVNGLGLPGSHLFENNFYCFLLVILFLHIIGDDVNNENLSQLSLCFAVTAIYLSITFIINQERFAVSYYNTDLERSGWTDANYFGMVLGMGCIFTLIQFFSSGWKETNLIQKIIYITALVISVPVLMLNASRGAVLSLSMGFVILMFVSKIKLIYKILVIIVVVAGLMYLYTNQYFDLLLYRIEMDDGTGSNRTVIWEQKLKIYARGNILHWLFGYGVLQGASLTGRTVGFHNDFVGYLVDYGIVGLSLLLYMLYYPIKIVPKGSPAKPIVITIIVYLIICFMTLEPFITGIMSYFVFYLYALLIARKEKMKKFIHED